MLAKSLIAVVAAALALAGAAMPTDKQATSVVGFARVAIDSAASFPSPVTTAGRHQFVILHAWKQDVARQLKAANPSLKILVYKNLSFVACDEYASNRFVPQGVRCPDVLAAHADWFLRDPAGSRLASRGYPWLWLADVGNSAYQDAWAANVIAEAKAEGWDGVFLDDANSTVKYHLDVGRVAKYPTDAAWAAATRSMLANVGPKIQSAGLLAIANICCTREHLGVWTEWLQFLSGGMDETFTKWGTSPSEGYIWDWGASGWRAQLNEVLDAESRGKYFIGVAHSAPGDARAARYALATMLLAGKGRSSFVLAPDYTNETWFPDYELAAQLGAPAGPHYTAGAVHRRDFAGGAVLVNPSRSAQTVHLRGTYFTVEGRKVSSVTLEATSGILLRDDRSGGASNSQKTSLGTPNVRIRLRVLRPWRTLAYAARAGLGSSARLVIRTRGRTLLVSRSGRATPIKRRPVQLFRSTTRGWRLVASVRTDKRGRFSIRRAVPGSARIVRLRAVARFAGADFRSRTVTIRVERAAR